MKLQIFCILALIYAPVNMHASSAGAGSSDSVARSDFHSLTPEKKQEFIVEQVQSLLSGDATAVMALKPCYLNSNTIRMMLTVLFDKVHEYSEFPVGVLLLPQTPLFMEIASKMLDESRFHDRVESYMEKAERLFVAENKRPLLEALEGIRLEPLRDGDEVATSIASGVDILKQACQAHLSEGSLNKDIAGVGSTLIPFHIPFQRFKELGWAPQSEEDTTQAHWEQMREAYAYLNALPGDADGIEVVFQELLAAQRRKMECLEQAANKVPALGDQLAKLKSTRSDFFGAAWSARESLQITVLSDMKAFEDEQIQYFTKLINESE